MADEGVDFGDALEELDGGVHIAGVADVDQTVPLLLLGLVDHEGFDPDIASLLQLLSGFGAHYY